jgi:DNA polymerase III delta prime subunit
MPIREEFLWVEKYRPNTVADTILPVDLKNTFQKFVDSGNIPNLLLTGGAGMGKTTIAKAMCEQIGCDYTMINGSLKGNIDTLRNDILNFASTVSIFGTGRKYVILDEADYLNVTSTQPALRNFMEEFSCNCGFILTANYPYKIIKEIHSRCSVIPFRMPKAEITKLMAAFYKRVRNILDEEKIEYDNEAVAEFVKVYFPDFRHCLVELQRYAMAGKIDTGILAVLKAGSIEALVQHIKAKNYTEARTWVAQNLDNDPTSFYRKFFDTATKYLKPNMVPALVLLIGKYQYQSSFVADQEVNADAFVAELMLESLYE